MKNDPTQQPVPTLVTNPRRFRFAGATLGGQTRPRGPVVENPVAGGQTFEVGGGQQMTDSPPPDYDAWATMGQAGANFADLTAPQQNVGGLPAELLRAFRHNHPFTPVYPLSSSIKTLVFDGATVQTFQLTDGCCAIMFSKSLAGDVIVNFQGSAAAIGATLDDHAIVNPPQGILFFIAGGRQLQAFGSAANVALTIYQYVQDVPAARRPKGSLL